MCNCIVYVHVFSVLNFVPLLLPYTAPSEGITSVSNVRSSRVSPCATTTITTTTATTAFYYCCQCIRRYNCLYLSDRHAQVLLSIGSCYKSRVCNITRARVCVCLGVRIYRVLCASTRCLGVCLSVCLSVCVFCCHFHSSSSTAVPACLCISDTVCKYTRLSVTVYINALRVQLHACETYVDVFVSSYIPSHCNDTVCIYESSFMQFLSAYDVNSFRLNGVM